MAFYALLAILIWAFIGIFSFVLSVIDINKYNFGLYLVLLSVVGITISVAFWIVTPSICQNPDWYDRFIRWSDERFEVWQAQQRRRRRRTRRERRRRSEAALRRRRRSSASTVRTLDAACESLPFFLTVSKGRRNSEKPGGQGGHKRHQQRLQARRRSDDRLGRLSARKRRHGAILELEEGARTPMPKRSTTWFQFPVRPGNNSAAVDSAIGSTIGDSSFTTAATITNHCHAHVMTNDQATQTVEGCSVKHTAIQTVDNITTNQSLSDTLQPMEMQTNERSSSVCISVDESFVEQETCADAPGYSNVVMEDDNSDDDEESIEFEINEPRPRSSTFAVRFLDVPRAKREQRASLDSWQRMAASWHGTDSQQRQRRGGNRLRSLGAIIAGQLRRVSGGRRSDRSRLQWGYSV